MTWQGGDLKENIRHNRNLTDAERDKAILFIGVDPYIERPRGCICLLQIRETHQHS